jgi:hypothetical protein
MGATMSLYSVKNIVDDLARASAEGKEVAS